MQKMSKSYGSSIGLTDGLPICSARSCHSRRAHGEYYRLASALPVDQIDEIGGLAADELHRTR
ncbi:MAG: hypothetical protein ACLSVD_13720 [Eggerthellaceae bacterium]